MVSPVQEYFSFYDDYIQFLCSDLWCIVSRGVSKYSAMVFKFALKLKCS